MIRGFLSKISVLLILLMAAGSAFWFFKTSSTKKALVAYIAESRGQLVADKVSVSGFPLSQKIVIDNLKLNRADGSQKFNPLNNQINIGKIEALSGIFSNDFKVVNFSDLSFQDVNGNNGKLQFKRQPKIDFVVLDKKIVKLTYQDDGYKIIDASDKVIFENGSSLISFESFSEDQNVVRNKIKIEFKDIIGDGLFDSKNDADIASAAANPAVVIQNNVAPSALDPKNSANKEVAKVEQKQAVGSNNKQKSENQVVANVVDVKKDGVAPTSGLAEDVAPTKIIKGNFYLDLEYTISPKIVSNSTGDASAKTLTDDSSPQLPNPELTADKKQAFVLNQISIKNLELSSDSYKFLLNAELTNDEKDFPFGSMTIKVSNLTNAINASKKFFVEASKETSPLSVSDISNQNSLVGDSLNKDKPPANKVPSVNNAQSESSVLPSSDKKPEPDVLVIISNLAKKNQNTNDETAVFNFEKEKGKEALINSTPLTELVNQLFLSSVANSVAGQNSGNEVK